VLWSPAHGIPGEKPEVYDATTIINRYNECITHYVREISEIIGRARLSNLIGLFIKTLMKIYPVDRIMNLIETIDAPTYKAQVQIELVKALGLAGKVEEAIGVMKEINQPEEKASAMLTLLDLIFVEPSFVQRLISPATLNEEASAPAASSPSRS
jgi:hypothetical protein